MLYRVMLYRGITVLSFYEEQVSESKYIFHFQFFKDITNHIEMVTHDRKVYICNCQSFD